MLKRRTVLAGLASVTTFSAAVPLAELFAASSGKKRVRYDARSTEGKAMLAIYAKGVDALKQAHADKPLSWTFQWYMHFVAGNSTKPKAIESVFGSKPSKARTLAELMWSTCQAHSGGSESNFLPWHRAYVLYFEKIIRSLTTDEFTLPYWNYTVDAAIPDEFLHKSSLKALYVDKRNDRTNKGEPIAGPGSINLASMDEADFLPGKDGIPQGFSENIDFNLHGAVHVNTGNSQNMGSIPWAAYDPIFWLHHCNIDRIWAGWNAQGGVNPTSNDWQAQRHAFLNSDAQLVYVTNAEMTSTDMLGYVYDNLPQKPKVVAQARVAEAQTEPSMSAATPAPASPIATLERAVTLGTGPTRVQLAPSRSIMAETQRAPGGAARRTYLVIGDIHTNVQPGVTYSIYTTDGSKTFLGAFQFFDAKPEGTTSRSRFVFDITDKVDPSKSPTPLSYEIVPDGSPDTTAKPLVGSINVVQK